MRLEWTRNGVPAGVVGVATPLPDTYNPYSDNWLHFHWRVHHGPYEGRVFVIRGEELNTV